MKTRWRKGSANSIRKPRRAKPPDPHKTETPALFFSGGDQTVEVKGVVEGPFGGFGFGFGGEGTTEYPSQRGIAADDLLEMGTIPLLPDLIPQSAGIVGIAKAAQLNDPGTFQGPFVFCGFRDLTL